MELSSAMQQYIQIMIRTTLENYSSAKVSVETARWSSVVTVKPVDCRGHHSARRPLFSAGRPRSL